MASDPNAPELVPLCSMRIEISEAIVLENTPAGTRMIGEIAAVRCQGERLNARQRGRAAADWLLLTPDGTGFVDVRLALETDDGALVYVEYTGRSNLDTGVAYSTPTFQTGDERYRWLNRVQCVARGHWDAEAMVMDYPMLYELR